MTYNLPVIPVYPLTFKEKIRLFFTQQQCSRDIGTKEKPVETKTYFKVMNDRIYVTKIEQSCPHGYWDYDNCPTCCH